MCATNHLCIREHFKNNRCRRMWYARAEWVYKRRQRCGLFQFRRSPLWCSFKWRYCISTGYQVWCVQPWFGSMWLPCCSGDQILLGLFHSKGWVTIRIILCMAHIVTWKKVQGYENKTIVFKICKFCEFSCRNQLSLESFLPIHAKYTSCISVRSKNLTCTGNVFQILAVEILT